ncbi:methylaspartate mutase subunit E [Epibacterium ulvae]|uniref:methylaspartate mutase subunit E n=1 Tax=Epibacterium ulvae TaxID=1156985 RepID=UPI00248F9BD0|nr:methylaspartate mutase subunit E [Epibacterium ulvae]
MNITESILPDYRESSVYVSKPNNHSIVLAGIGSDSHSVGLWLLRQALIRNNYRLRYLGIQTDIKELLDAAQDADLVMVSVMDGHATHYLNSDFRTSEAAGQVPGKWYLGGNLSVDRDNVEVIKHFRALGFDRVFPEYVDMGTVLEAIEYDLRDVSPRLPRTGNALTTGLKKRFQGTLPDGQLCKNQFLNIRREVLSGWKTGEQALSLSETARYMRERSLFSEALAQTDCAAEPAILQLRSGVASPADQALIFRTFQDTGVDVLSYQIDSLTRNNNYIGVENAMQNGALNGFPAVNHGVETLRQIAEQVELPIQTRHSSKDPRLLAEISLAGGVSAYEGGAICYNLPYYKDLDPRLSIERWKYVDRLAGIMFEDHGIKIDREFFGTLTGTLVPPCIQIVTNVIETLLAVYQGVKCVTLGYAEQGNRSQDIAAIRLMKSLAIRYLEQYGFVDVDVYTAFYQYMAAFPVSEEKARQLISGSAATAGMAGANKLVTKSPVEARKIPSLRENLEGFEIARAAIQSFEPDECRVSEIEKETEVLFAEVTGIMSVVIGGPRSLEDNVVSAFANGTIDIPFSPSRFVAGKIKTMRDERGAVRIRDFGNIPATPEIKAFHWAQLRPRLETTECARHVHEEDLIAHDILAIQGGLFADWPLDAPAKDC